MDISLESQIHEEKFANGKNKTALKNKFMFLSQKASTIRQFLNLSSSESIKSFEEVLMNNISNRKENFSSLTVSTDQNLQKFMDIIFCKEMGSWKAELGKEINIILESESPELLKSTLLFYFFKSFDISKQAS